MLTERTDRADDPATDRRSVVGAFLGAAGPKLRVVVRFARSSVALRALPARVLGVAVLSGATLLAGTTLLGACGGGRGVPPERWAAEVCAALTPWRTQIVALNTQAQQQVAAATAPEQARAGLLDLLRGAETASETARAAVAAAGAPSVGGGEAIAFHFTNSLSTIRDAYARARRDLEALPVADDDVFYDRFYDRVEAVFGQLGRDYAAAASDLDRVAVPDLRRAFDEVDECR